MRKKKSKPFLEKRQQKLNPSISSDDGSGDGPMRLNKYVAHCGICSRRKAADLVKGGQVEVNGEVERNPAYEVQKSDVVKYKGEVILPEKSLIYLLLNKPKDTLSTVTDDRGRKTVMDLLDANIKLRVYPVGRLDQATTGLLLLTNDGKLTQKLAHPSYEVKKVYHVVLDKPVSENDLQRIADGLELEDGKALVDGVNYVKGKGKNEVGIELHIGRNRIVRRIFEHLDYRVKHLDRTFYAGLTKKDLPRGHYRALSDREVIMLKHFV